MHLLILLSFVLLGLLMYYLIDYFYRTTWIVVLVIVVISFVIVFVAGTLFTGRSSYYFRVLEQKETVLHPFTYFNNFWKYGRMYCAKLLKIIIKIAIISFAILVGTLILYKGLGNKFFEMLAMDNYVGEEKDIFKIIGGIIKGVSLSTTATTVFCTIGVLFVLIPAVKSFYNYSFVEYIMADNKLMKISDCLEKSKYYTKIYSKNYLSFILNFVPQYMFCVASLGIYAIWFVPYFRTAKALFYRDIQSDF